MHPLDRINPFIKLLAALLLSSLGWFAGSALASALAAAIALFGVIICRLPQTSGYLKLMALVGGLVTLSWTLSFVWNGVPIATAINDALGMAFRLIATTGSFFIAIETTSAGSLLAACSRLRLPGFVTLVLVLVVGMIPLMREEFRNIGETQRARGLELDRGPLAKRIVYALGRGVPLMVQTYRMAEMIALALSIYGFDPKVARTSWRDIGWLTIQTTFPPTLPMR
ncbi:energy-coupling factor transporter transmembrane component T [Bradyrhizobium sp. ARR65]|uniref:energy-coupling factor transporter transmembrane component T family protein n=1 Tax=Bradyrhizobium sp. ARR65 TaxID=1040989 RepID=UPI000466D7B8|nr:energy-coupling factor transporter transmembrane component T [Bradyrhizobium sp. ARR65]